MVKDSYNVPIKRECSSYQLNSNNIAQYYSPKKENQYQLTEQKKNANQYPTYIERISYRTTKKHTLNKQQPKKGRFQLVNNNSLQQSIEAEHNQGKTHTSPQTSLENIKALS